VRVAHAPLGRIDYHSLRDGRLAELYRPIYQDAIDAAEQPAGYRQAFYLMRALRIDGEQATMKDVLDFDATDATYLLRVLLQTLKG